MKKGLFILLQLSWGLLTNIVGFLLVLAFCPFSTIRFDHTHMVFDVAVRIGKGWGMSLGIFILQSASNVSVVTSSHEYGHTIQNMIFGPLFLILIGIPSTIRFWYRRIFGSSRDYDAIWFESWATSLGRKYY